MKMKKQGINIGIKYALRNEQEQSNLYKNFCEKYGVKFPVTIDILDKIATGKIASYLEKQKIITAKAEKYDINFPNIIDIPGKITTEKIVSYFEKYVI